MNSEQSLTNYSDAVLGLLQHRLVHYLAKTEMSNISRLIVQGHANNRTPENTAQLIENLVRS